MKLLSDAQARALRTLAKGPTRWTNAKTFSVLLHLRLARVEPSSGADIITPWGRRVLRAHEALQAKDPEG